MGGLTDLAEVLDWGQLLFAFGALVAALATGGLSAFQLKKSFFALQSLKTEMAGTPTGGAEATDPPALPSSSPTAAFETRALSNYYSHALLRANVSFWFSLTFAAIGFGVIIFAFLTYSPDDIGGAIFKASTGVIIDAVASLFFVQSTNAQKSMGEFFEKLRLDRLNAEARTLLSEIENAERRDEVRTQLVLKYSSIDRLVVGDKPT